ncbi:hypothetical protein BD414DRAFT_168330 [Trametes punicea]|nr:hypothetical protein BD414DRAFT_168330 [Trametes punicea]
MPNRAAASGVLWSRRRRMCRPPLTQPCPLRCITNLPLVPVPDSQYRYGNISQIIRALRGASASLRPQCTGSQAVRRARASREVQDIARGTDPHRLVNMDICPPVCYWAVHPDPYDYNLKHGMKTGRIVTIGKESAKDELASSFGYTALTPLGEAWHEQQEFYGRRTSRSRLHACIPRLWSRVLDEYSYIACCYIAFRTLQKRKKNCVNTVWLLQRAYARRREAAKSQ